MVEAVYGRGHLTSIQGLLKLLEIAFLILLCFLISYGGYGHNDVLRALFAGAIIGLLISSLLLTFGCSGADGEGILKLQCFFHFSWFLYLIVSASYFLANYEDSTDTYKAAAAFGIITALTYLVDGIHSYLVYKPFP